MSLRSQIEFLARQGIFDEDGHVSLRHPDDPSRYLLARARSPALVEPDDILEFSLDGDPVAADARALCTERFVHGAVLAARPDIHAVLFARSEDLLPFSVTRSKLRAVIASVGDMGTHVPVWDVAGKFGDATDLSLSNIERARDLARRLKSDRVVLLRGIGFVATGRSLNDVVRMSIYLPRNAAGTRRRDAIRQDRRHFRGRGAGAPGHRPRVERHAPRLGLLGARSRLRPLADRLMLRTETSPSW